MTEKDHLDELLNNARERDMWQDIETAPKDVRVLLGRFVKGDEHDGYISVDRWRSRDKGDSYEGFGQFNERYWPATHWMPLPAPPKP